MYRYCQGVYSEVEALPFSMNANKTDPNPAIIVSGNTYNRNSKEFEVTVDAMYNGQYTLINILDKYFNHLIKKIMNFLEKFINVSDTQNNNKYFKLKIMPIQSSKSNKY